MTPERQPIKAHPELTAADLIEFEQKLLGEKTDLEKLWEELKEKERELLDTQETTADQSDQARQYEGRSETFKQLERTEERLRQVSQALERLKQPGAAYGFCIKCGQAIPKERLALDPSFETCIRHTK